MTTTIILNEEQKEKLARAMLSLNFNKQKVFNSFVDAANYVETQLKTNALTGGILKVRSGRLRNSIGFLITASKTELTAEIGSGVRQREPVKYAAILEQGGTIIPKNKQFLTVPLGYKGNPVMTPTGTVKAGMTAGELHAKKKTFIIVKTIFLKTGKRAIKPIYSLVRSVNIPAFKYMEKTAQAAAQRVQEIIGEGIKDSIAEEFKQ